MARVSFRGRYFFAAKFHFTVSSGSRYSRSRRFPPRGLPANPGESVPAPTRPHGSPPVEQRGGGGSRVVELEARKCPLCGADGLTVRQEVLRCRAVGVERRSTHDVHWTLNVKSGSQPSGNRRSRHLFACRAFECLGRPGSSSSIGRIAVNPRGAICGHHLDSIVRPGYKAVRPLRKI